MRDWNRSHPAGLDQPSVSSGSSRLASWAVGEPWPTECLTARASQRVVRDRVAVQINGGAQLVSLAVKPVAEGKETAYGVVFIDRGPTRN